ncbi:ATP-binding protein [Pueribacillus sp. YX66]|uniref:ATP-binding protein n=1 Tax=Pueribacillus sp. YX66 TaxID=3229242 RepID=UPI00358CE3A2
MHNIHSSLNEHSFELKFEKYDLVVIDELGYISFDKEGAELLFTHLAGRKSTIITSNLPFLKWQDIFHDPLTAALIIGLRINRTSLI